MRFEVIWLVEEDGKTFCVIAEEGNVKYHYEDVKFCLGDYYHHKNISKDIREHMKYELTLLKNGIRSGIFGFISKMEHGEMEFYKSDGDVHNCGIEVGKFEKRVYLKKAKINILEKVTGLPG